MFDIFPTKEGYQFDGFMNGGKIYTSFTVTKNLTLYAQFSERDYIIQYNLDGGTCNDLVESFRDPSKVVLPIPTKDGYKFVGWYDTNNLDEKIENLESKDYTLTAKWQKLYYVTYDLDGGICDNLISEFSEEINNLPIPVKEGYEFLGWYLISSDEKVENLELRNYTLTAKWQKKIYFATYDLDGGSCDNLIYEFYDQINILPIPVKEGYEFIGWYLVDSDTKVEIFELKDYSLVAKWEKEIYTITYDLDGGTCDNLIYEFENRIDSLPVPVKDGYEFIGWYLIDLDTKIETLELKDYVLVAKWKEIIFKITYILNGNNNEEVETFKSADEVILKEPTLEGYKFIGWFELNNGEEVKVEKLENRDYVLYAKYEEISGCGSSMLKLIFSISLLFMALIKRRK